MVLFPQHLAYFFELSSLHYTSKTCFSPAPGTGRGIYQARFCHYTSLSAVEEDQPPHQGPAPVGSWRFQIPGLILLGRWRVTSEAEWRWPRSAGWLPWWLHSNHRCVHILFLEQQQLRHLPSGHLEAIRSKELRHHPSQTLGS